MMTLRGILGVCEYDAVSLLAEGVANAGVLNDGDTEAPGNEGETLTAVDWKTW